MRIFSFLTRKVGEKTADFWTGRGMKSLQEENFKEAIKAFDEVNKLYRVEGFTDPLWRADSKEYLPNIYMSFLGLALAYAGLNKLIPADDNFRKVKTLVERYQAPNPKDYLKKMGLDNLIRLLNFIESYK
jgi:hypothetical protein